jgi:hypothetical protein
MNVIDSGRDCIPSPLAGEGGPERSEEPGEGSPLKPRRMQALASATKSIQDLSEALAGIMPGSQERRDSNLRPLILDLI